MLARSGGFGWCLGGFLKRLAYNLALGIGLGAATPWLGARLARGRYRQIALARLGLGSAWLPAPPPGGGIWVHALSVGEVGSALPLLTALGRRYPHKPLMLSVATAQGLAVAKEALAGSGVILFIRPLDLPWARQRLIRHLRPSLFCQVEGDIWPGWLWAMAEQGIPRMLVNGRISPRTFKGYRRLRTLARELFRGFDRVLVQTEVDYQRLSSVGVKGGCLAVGGNLKFDSAPAELEEKQRSLLAQELGLSGCKVLVAGSTHPGEEEPCLEAFAALHRDHPDLALLLAPREVSRGRSLAQMAAHRGFKVFQASQGAPPPGVQVLVLDVLGKLAQAYALGVAAFVGGSLVPVGGHNLLEPAAQGVPVLFGPHTHNFLTMAQSLEAAGGGIRISQGQELKAAWGDFLSQPEKTRQAGRAAQGFCQAHRGAVDRAVAEAQALLESV